jgi:outer membrane immunogenic protein
MSDEWGFIMKKLLLGTVALVGLAAANPAFAADLPYRAPAYKAPIMAPVAFSWTGCYVGAHVGGGWGNKRWDDPLLGGVEFSNHDVNGWLAGGQIGCNYQTGQFVFGVEGDASWANIRGSGPDTLSFGTLTDNSKVDFLGTLTGRAGIAWDRALFYVKGGGAWAHDKFWAVRNVTGSTFYSADDTRWGWTVGAGVEYAFAPSWTAKIEYDYLDFGKQSATFSGPTFAGPPFNFDIDQRIHVVKAGINYKFW